MNNFQSRADRDEYVEILTQNIMAGMACTCITITFRSYKSLRFRLANYYNATILFVLFCIYIS